MMISKKNIYLKKIYYTIVIISFFSFFVFGVSASSVGNALKSFTKKEYDLIFKSQLSNMNDEYSDIFDISKRINIYTNLKGSAIDVRKEAEQKVESIVTKVSSLENTLKIIDQNISEAMKNIKEANDDIVKTKKKIDINSEIIKLLKSKIKKNEDILYKYLEYSYKKENTAFKDSSSTMDNLKSILLNNQKISDLLDDFYFDSLIQLTGKELLEKHKKYVLDLYVKKVNLEKERNSLNLTRKQLIVVQKDLKDKKRFKESLLEASKGQQKQYEKYLDKKIEIENNIRKMAVREKIKFDTLKNEILDKYGCKFIDISINTSELRAMKANFPKCYNINKMIYSESKLSREAKLNPSDISGLITIPWPIDPYKGISAYYHDREYEKEFGYEHNAIDIRASQGTPITAPMDGYVVYLNKPNGPDYSFLAIKSFDGYVTVYGHLSEIMVDEYDYIKKGQIFAKTGGEFGTAGAGYITSGPHLHFEVFKNREYIDPLDVLDLSYLNYNSLPRKRYKMKYLFDFKNRRGYDYNERLDNVLVFRLKGNDEIERQKYLLSHYASSVFGNWQNWIDEGVNGNIDPSFLMCIGLAESGLGYNLTTRYNIGNVGNNDRGDRVPYNSPKEGISAMVYALNNKYLGSYNRLDQLSGAGRLGSGLASCKTPGQYCYASDLKYWHSNVLSCMSHLKGYVIPNDYNFRLVNY